jgi:hypothetical protein
VSGLVEAALECPLKVGFEQSSPFDNATFTNACLAGLVLELGGIGGDEFCVVAD